MLVLLVFRSGLRYGPRWNLSVNVMGHDFSSTSATVSTIRIVLYHYRAVVVVVLFP